MNGKLKKLKDNLGKYIFPVTVSEAVYVEDTKTLKTKLTEIEQLVGSGSTGSNAVTIQDFYKQTKVGKRLVFVGDSTTDVAPALFSRLSSYMAVGGALEGASYVNRGNNGGTVRQFVTNTGTKNGISTVIADQADLYILSYGINDIRTGGSVDQIKKDLKETIDKMLKETKAFILLRIPNPFLTTSTSGWVTPNASAQEYSSQLWEVFESFRGYSERLDIIDIPNLVFGKKCLAKHPLMYDQLHPNDLGYKSIADEIAERISGKRKDFNEFYDYEVLMKGWIDDTTTDISNTTLKFYTNNVRELKVDDIVFVGNSYSFVIETAPTLNTNSWTIPHTHTGDFSRFGVVKVLRKKA
jgi:lysophospholipase L1-like esterase